jgi:heterogeneous nuclear ribonucleoprotein U-like protein 1
MEQAAPDKMKVAELRAALQERGLDTKGTKPVLVARLQEAFDAEKPAEEEVPAAAAEEKMETEAGAAEEPAKAESMETGEAAAKTEETPAEGKPAENKTEAKVEKKEEEKGTKRKADEEPPFEVKENEPEIPEALVCLDWYNSDLNLRITDNYMTGIPFSRDGWGYCYAGARATYGFNSGKVWFEVKYLDNLDVKVEKDAVTFDLRVGWSSNKGSLMLGEDDKSWCYSSAEGKMAHMKTFEEYGEKFTKGDVVGAYIDFEGDEVSLTFTKNGEDQGDAFQIPKAELNGEALFPHIMARNVKFDVNFGLDKEDKVVEDLKEKLDGAYIKAGSVPIDQRVRGSARIATREECELVMMVGLPASGKTTWVEKHVADNAEKQYNVISTTTMINKMTVNGEPRKKHHTGKWELVVQKATRSLQEMLRAASQRRRNVIIDQTNVYGNAQKRKSRPFEGFQRRAVVLVPCDEDYKARCKAQEDAGCKDIPDDAIMEMKANFALPEEDKEAVVPTFVEITFVELDREEAMKIVEQYNKVAKEKGFGKKHEERKNKKFRGSDGTRPRGNFRGARGAPGFVPRGGRPMRGNFRAGG